MKENIVLVWEGYVENWKECNVLGKFFQIIITPVWILFALIITAVEWLADNIGRVVEKIQKLCTKKKYR